MTIDELDRDPDARTAEMRAAFDVEPEVDTVLERKLRHRPSGPYEPATLEQLTDGARKLLAGRGPAEFEIEDARWFTGGASKLQMGFTLRAKEDQNGERLIVRMDPSGVSTPRASGVSSR